MRLLPLADGATWQVRLDDQTMPLQTLEKWLLHPEALHLVAKVGTRILVAPLSATTRTLLETLATQPILPPQAVAALLPRLPQWARLIAIDVPDRLRGKQKPPNPRPLLRLDALPDGRLTIRPLVRPLAGGVALPPGEGIADVYGQEDNKPVWTRRDLVNERNRWEDLRDRLGLPLDVGHQLELDGEEALDCVVKLAALADHADVEWARQK